MHQWSRIGYRRDWAGFPGAQRGLGFEFVDPYDDVVVVQGRGSTISVLEASTGAVRWKNTLANPLTDFVGNVRAGNYIHSSSESQVFSLDMQTGNLVDRQSLSEPVSQASSAFAGSARSLPERLAAQAQRAPSRSAAQVLL